MLILSWGVFPQTRCEEPPGNSLWEPTAEHAESSGKEIRSSLQGELGEVAEQSDTGAKGVKCLMALEIVFNSQSMFESLQELLMILCKLLRKLPQSNSDPMQK